MKLYVKISSLSIFLQEFCLFGIFISVFFFIFAVRTTNALNFRVSRTEKGCHMLIDKAAYTIADMQLKCVCPKVPS